MLTIFDSVHSHNAHLGSFETPVIYTPSAGQGVTLNDVNVCTIGKVAIVNLSFTCSATISSTATLVSGIPIPKSTVPVVCSRNLGAGSSQALISTAGNLNNNWDGFESGKKYFCNVSYVIN